MAHAPRIEDGLTEKRSFCTLSPDMSRICELTGKSAKTVNSRSHSNIATKRSQKVNLQTVRIGGRKFRVAARTKRTLEKLAKQYAGELPSKRQKKAAKTAERMKQKAKAEAKK